MKMYFMLKKLAVIFIFCATLHMVHNSAISETSLSSLEIGINAVNAGKPLPEIFTAIINNEKNTFPESEWDKAYNSVVKIIMKMLFDKSKSITDIVAAAIKANPSSEDFIVTTAKEIAPNQSAAIDKASADALSSVSSSTGESKPKTYNTTLDLNKYITITDDTFQNSQIKWTFENDEKIIVAYDRTTQTAKITVKGPLPTNAVLKLIATDDSDGTTSNATTTLTLGN